MLVGRRRRPDRGRHRLPRRRGRRPRPRHRLGDDPDLRRTTIVFGRPPGLDAGGGRRRTSANVASWRALEKAGFRSRRRPSTTSDGTCRVMVIDRTLPAMSEPTVLTACTRSTATSPRITLNRPAPAQRHLVPDARTADRAPHRGRARPRRALRDHHRRRQGVLLRARPAGRRRRHRHRRLGVATAAAGWATPATCPTVVLQRDGHAGHRRHQRRRRRLRPRPRPRLRPPAASPSSARLLPGFAKRGVVPESGGTWYLPRLVGWAKACEIGFLGRDLDAAESERLGLVNLVVARRRAARHRPVVGRGDRRQRSARRAVDEAPVPPRPHRGLRLATPTTCCSRSMQLFGTKDFAEGVNSFLEKRDPEFEGR